MLKVGTVISGLFCLRHADFEATLPMRFSRKIWNIILGILLAMLINCFLDNPVENLNWMIINGRFTFWAALTMLEIVGEFPWVSAIRNCGWTEKVFSLLLRIFSLCGGVAAFVGAYHGNLWMLKIGTVLAGLFCMWEMGSDAVGAKLKIIAGGSIVGMLINRFLKTPLEGLGWMIVDAVFILHVIGSISSIIMDLQCEFAFWQDKRKQSKN